MRRVEPRQLTFVFADSPEGGKGSRKRDESRGRPYLLHIAKAMTATSSTTTESKPERLLESMTHPANLATALRNVARNNQKRHRFLLRALCARCESAWPPGRHGVVGINFLCLTMKNSFQRAGCEAHKSGSVRGVVGRPAIPTRRAPGMDEWRRVQVPYGASWRQP